MFCEINLFTVKWVHGGEKNDWEALVLKRHTFAVLRDLQNTYLSNILLRDERSSFFIKSAQHIRYTKGLREWRKERLCYAARTFCCPDLSNLREMMSHSKFFWLITFILCWNISILMGVEVFSSRMIRYPSTGHEDLLSGSGSKKHVGNLQISNQLNTNERFRSYTLKSALRLRRWWSPSSNH